MSFSAPDKKNEFPCVYINFPMSFSTTDKEMVNFPVCTKISPCVLPQPTRKGVFPCVFGYFPVNVFVTDKKR